MSVAGYEPAANQPPIVGINNVGADYAKTMRMPLVTSRDLGPEDVAWQPRVAIINETMARYWPDRDPIGGRFMFGWVSPENSTWYTLAALARRSGTAGRFAP